MGNPSSRRRRRRFGLIVVALFVGLVALPAGAEDPLDPYLGDPGRTYPNLVPNIQDVQVQDTRTVNELDTEEGLYLWFDTRAQNLGTVPVQVTIDEVDSPQSSTVSQCVSWRSNEGHICREAELVGGYTWHEAHSHFHYRDFATYELRSLGPDGNADYSEEGLLRRSGKVSFCFYDIAKVDPNASPVGYYTQANCAAPVVMGVSPGWTDIYDSSLEGQNIDIQGLPNGEYALITHMNYEGTLRETSYEDNVIEAIVRISDTDELQFPLGRKAEILRKRWPTAADRTATTTTTTTTTTSTTTTTTTVASSTTTTVLEGARVLDGSTTYVAVPRRRPLPQVRECSSRSRSCHRTWARP